MNQIYRTPPGYRDTPFIYVYDPFVLDGPYPFTDSADLIYRVSTSSIQNQSVALQYGEQFILRRVDPSFMVIGPLFPSDLPGGLKLRDDRARDRFSAWRPLTATDWDIRLQPMNCSLPICPESLYGVRSQMAFDMQGVRLRFNSEVPSAQPNTVPLSQLLFQGVRRYPWNAPDNRLLADGWEERPYIYPIDIPIDWFYWDGGLAVNGRSQPRRFNIQITDWDFLLLDIRTPNDFIPGGEGNDGIVECARMTLYDYAQNALSSAPVNLHAMNSADDAGAQGGGIGGTAGAGALCPPVLYPNRSTIQFDITSMLEVDVAPAGTTITLQFVGRRRWPRNLK